MPRLTPRFADTSRVPFAAAALVAALALAAWASSAEPRPDASTLDMPWREAGLTERQAARHLLDRFTFGPRPGEVDRVVDQGLERWFLEQLDGDLETPRLDEFLEGRPSLGLPAAELARLYPAGLRNQRDALADLMIQKLARARYAENQLHEVLTDFFFNHFNVSLTDNQARIYLWPYERDAIRPYVVGSFRHMLGATARHPAMLLYLDNALSVADEGVTTTLDLRLRQVAGPGRRIGRRALDRARRADDAERPRRATGLNENYARELMELHTLGVDGGYDQSDVVEVARAFTGWSVVPPDGLPGRLERADERRRRRAGFVIDGAFLFRADAHDAESKRVLGHDLPAGRGIEDGEEVLDLLASHPSTAGHLGRKLAVRFVSDEPPAALVDRLAAVFSRTDGDLRAVLTALVESPEFWSDDAVGQKIKSPLELAISSLRALDVHPRDPRELLDWIRRMGQPLYAYQAPTGFPDRAEHWVNTGALLQRMNFGLQLATNRLPGLRVQVEESDAPGFAPEPSDRASHEALLRHWLGVLLPERDVESTVRRLLPVVTDPDLSTKVTETAPESETPPPGWFEAVDERGMAFDDWDVSRGPRTDRRPGARHPYMTLRSGARHPYMTLRSGARHPDDRHPDDSLSAHVVGVILGSPEFQRR